VKNENCRKKTWKTIKKEGRYSYYEAGEGTTDSSSRIIMARNLMV
jgi:hypothetical protein